jgi:4-alpha-glucanotransferase
MLRKTGYEAFIALVRANMRHAGALRIDHVIGLQHLYWVPEGHPPTEGAYISYPFEDLTGILALESHRNRCLVVGEDLGTVPPGFRDKMASLGIFSYKILYFEQDSKSGTFIPPEDYPPLSLATVGSHDLATLRGWWQGHDIELRESKHLYSNPAEGPRQREIREKEKLRLLEALKRDGHEPGDGSDFEQLACAVHTFLGGSKAAIAMLQLENLIGEVAQVNLPGTIDQYPNWRRRLGIKIESLENDPRVNAIIQSMAGGRKETGNLHS